MGFKSWCPKDLRVHAPVLTHSLSLFTVFKYWLMSFWVFFGSSFLEAFVSIFELNTFMLKSCLKMNLKKYWSSVFEFWEVAFSFSFSVLYAQFKVYLNIEWLPYTHFKPASFSKWAWGNLGRQYLVLRSDVWFFL